MEKVPLSFFSNVLKKRSVYNIISRSKSDGHSKTLGWLDILILGISVVIGSGIFVMVGEAACGNVEHVGAGPSLVISIILAGIACIFPALCYAEFASTLPDSGSSYTYIYSTMGEFAAWMTGWVLILEYSITNITISVAWSGYLFQFLAGFSDVLPSLIVNPPVWLVNDYNTAVLKCQVAGVNLDTIPQIFGIPFSVNLPAVLILLSMAYILTKGTKESAKTATLMVFIKMSVILLFVLVCAFYVKPSNWIPFMPNGWNGVILGTFIIFYAYLGFDALATTAEETKNPQKNLPIGIIGTLVIASIVYCAVALVFTGVIPFSQYGIVDIHAPIAHITRLIHQDWVAGFISIGAIAGLTSVLLVLQYANSRIIYAMARDNFLPKILKKRHRKHKTPHVIIWGSAILLTLCGLFVDMSVAAQLCVFGTLTCFILVCIGILILRKTHPDIDRPFKVPFCPWFPIFGTIICITLMIKSIPNLEKSSILFPIWIVFGIIIYIMYGYDKNRAAEEKERNLIEHHKKIREGKNV